MSEVGSVYVGGRTEYVENVDEDHLSIPEFADYDKCFGISKLGKAYAAPSLGGDLVELKNDMDISSITLFMCVITLFWMMWVLVKVILVNL